MWKQLSKCLLNLTTKKLFLCRNDGYQVKYCNGKMSLDFHRNQMYFKFNTINRSFKIANDTTIYRSMNNYESNKSNDESTQ